MHAINTQNCKFIALLASSTGIRREVSVAELCTEFKCNAIKTSIRQALEAYKRQFWSSLKTEEQQKNADFSRFLQNTLPLTTHSHNTPQANNFSNPQTDIVSAQSPPSPLPSRVLFHTGLSLPWRPSISPQKSTSTWSKCPSSANFSRPVT
jgi:hypothetical protein